MKGILIVFFIALLLVLLFTLPFKVRFMAHFNLLDFKGFYSVKLLSIKFLCGMVYRENGKIKVENSADIFSGNMSKPFVRALIGEMTKKIDVKKVEIYFTGGFKENSFSSAIVCGGVSSFVQTLYSVLSQKYKNVKLYEDVITTFKEDNLELTFDIAVSISLFQIAISLIKSLLKKEVKEAKNEG